jgi:hypothetical protein
MDDVTEGKAPKGKGSSRRTSRLQRHLNTALALAGDRPEWVNAFLLRVQRLIWRPCTKPSNKYRLRWKFDI